jgi:hypothetical protein
MTAVQLSPLIPTVTACGYCPYENSPDLLAGRGCSRKDSSRKHTSLGAVDSPVHCKVYLSYLFSNRFPTNVV